MSDTGFSALTPEEKEKLWSRILDFVEGLDRGVQVQAIQIYTQEGGPIPDRFRDRVARILGGAEDLAREIEMRSEQMTAPWWEGLLLDPASESDTERAWKVARGLLPSEGLVMCPLPVYAGHSATAHPHPQRWPCFTSCYIPERVPEESC